MDSNTITLHLYSSLLLLLVLFTTTASGGGFNINYGQVADNPPDPYAVASLIKSIHASRLRIYDTDTLVLKAFANSGVELTVSLPNENLTQISDPTKAEAWVQTNVQCYLPATKITGIAVGNEFLTSNDTAHYSPSVLLTAMENIHAALVSLKLNHKVAVTTSHNYGILKSSYPPSAGEFRKDLSQPLKRILEFHCRTGSPFSINAYPFFAYNSDPKHISLKYALFGPSEAVVDSGSGLKYDNMFLAQIDAAHWAMEKLGYKNVCLEVSETGWPTKGDANEAGATPENARTYNWNLLKLIESKKGTPKMPDMDLNVYIFALFNENLKPGPTSERNFGLFKPDRTPAYDLGFNVTGGRAPSGSPMVVLPPPGGYMPIDDHAPERLPTGGLLLVSLLCLAISAVFARQF